jgi:hypothetical protein
VAIAYVIGFFVMLAILGWHPDAPHRKRAALACDETPILCNGFTAAPAADASAAGPA